MPERISVVNPFFTPVLTGGAVKEFVYTNDFLTKDDFDYVNKVRDNHIWFEGKKFSMEVRERFAKYVGSTVEKVEEKRKQKWFSFIV